MGEAGYKKLIVWQKADELAKFVYRETKNFPQEEIYGITSQLRRAALSIPTNIVEGYARQGKKELKQFFGRPTLRMLVLQPLEAVSLNQKVDVIANVRGGGLAGQAGAIRHAIYRALVQYDETLKGLLRKGDYLTRDPRMKERKKYGRRGARRRFQFSKR